MGKGPYIRDDHYMYGSMHLQPYPAYYNSAWFHRRPPRRDLGSLYQFYDDGNMYVLDCKDGDPSLPVLRNEKFHNVVNIETLAFRSLRIKLYAMEEENDTDIVLELGGCYQITYITEGGLKVATGVLKLIDSAIPDTCVRYIGEFNQLVTTAWIGMDCSVPGKSDKRKIYIAAIRAISIVDPAELGIKQSEVDTDTMTDSEKLNYMIGKIDQILKKVADNDEIMAKLDEMDPTEKLEYIINTLESHVEENITSHIAQLKALKSGKDSDSGSSEIEKDGYEVPLKNEI